MKNEKIFYILAFTFFIVMIAGILFSFINTQVSAISNSLLISFNTDYISIFNPNSNQVVNKIHLDLPYVIKKVLRYNDAIYLIATHQVILIGMNGSIKKIVNTNDTLVDGIIKDGNLYTVGIIQVAPCNLSSNLSNLAEGYKSYITTFDSSLSQLSKLEFDQYVFYGLAILNTSLFVSSFFDSKIYEIHNGKIINSIQLPEGSFPSQIFNFGGKIIVIGKKEIFILPTTLSNFDILVNKSICNHYARAFIYNNNLYATCFTGNKTIVYDLVQNKLIKQINTTLPYYVWGFKDKIYVTSVFEKKLYVINPSTNELIATIDFDERPTVVG
jgi:YVTN family beta-propeller protein